MKLRLRFTRIAPNGPVLHKIGDAGEPGKILRPPGCRPLQGGARWQWRLQLNQSMRLTRRECWVAKACASAGLTFAHAAIPHARHCERRALSPPRGGPP